MTELTYPNFVANQVLTNRQLNDLRDYLDAQTRTGRLRTVGTGILCGLSWHLDVRAGETALVIERGYGLTSAGHLITLDAGSEPLEFVGTTRYCDPNVDPDAESADDAECSVPAYEPWVTGVAPPRHIDLVELATRDRMTTAPERFTPLTSGDLEDRVPLLYLEEVTQELDSCIVTSCEGMGEDVHFTVRVLLARKADLEALTALPDCPAALPPLILPRFHAFVRESEAGDLRGLRSAEDIDAAYAEAVDYGVERLAERIETVHADYGRRFDLDRTAGEDARDGLERILGRMEEDPRMSQPLYDVLRILIDAANDLAVRACRASRSCGVATGFDRHLMLGSHDHDRGYRHLFRPAPPHQIEGDADADVAYAFERLVRMIRGVVLEVEERGFDVRILPSGQSGEPMATRAVPAILEVDAIREFWHDERCCDARPLVHYFLSADETYDDLPFALETVEADARGPSLLRVDGHLGGDGPDVITQLIELRRRLNLEFTIVVLGFEEGDALEELRDGLRERSVSGVLVDVYEAFVTAHPGIEPLHGVPPGGTFVLVVEEGRIVADFALHCCTLARTEEESFVSGMVVADGPVEEATVRLDPEEASESSLETGDDGRFDFGAVPPGTYTVTAGREGFQSQSVTVTLTPGESESVILILQPAEDRVAITGIVYEAPNTEDRIPGANVVVTTVPGRGTATNADGEFSISDLPRQTHGLRVESVGFQPATTQVEFSEDETTKRVEIPLTTATVSIAGTVVDSQTEASIGGVTVRITGGGGSVTTPDDGSWRFDDLSPGTYEVTAQTDGYETASVSRTLSAGQDVTDVTIPLAPVTVGVDVLLCGGRHPELEIRWDDEVVLEGATSPVHSGWIDRRPGTHKLALITSDGEQLASEDITIEPDRNVLVVVTGDLVQEQVIVSAIPLAEVPPLRSDVFVRFAMGFPEDQTATFLVNQQPVAESVPFETATNGQLLPARELFVAGQVRAADFARSGQLDLSEQNRRPGTIVLCRDALHYVGDDGTLITAQPVG